MCFSSILKKLWETNLEVKCFGKYTFKIEDPSKFMNEIAGIANIYRKEQLTEQMR